MNQRWESLLRPDAESASHAPDAGEALAVWILGIMWAIACLLLGYLGGPWVVPGALVAGLLAIWGWKHMEWLWWFPTILVVATLIEPLSPLPELTHFGSLVYTDLLTLGVALVALARAVGLRKRLLPRTAVDPLVLIVVALFMLVQFSAAARAHTLVDLKMFIAGLVVFYASATVASRPRGSRWVWIAFPLATALIGIHAVWMSGLGGGVLGAQLDHADAVWGVHNGSFRTLLVALPVTIGLAASAGQVRARAAWLIAATLGAVGVVLHGMATHVFGPVEGLDASDPLVMLRKVVAAVALFTLARFAWRVRRGRRHEGPRWFAVTFTFVSFGCLELQWSALSGPVLPLLMVAAGLVAGTHQADCRAAAAATSPATPKADDADHATERAA